MIKVSKDGLETKVGERALKSYLDNGWEVVVEDEKPMPTTYDSFTTKQLIDIGKARKIDLSGLSVKEMKGALIGIDEKLEAVKRPTNKGFTDNLILD